MEYGRYRTLVVRPHRRSRAIWILDPRLQAAEYATGRTSRVSTQQATRRPAVATHTNSSDHSPSLSHHRGSGDTHTPLRPLFAPATTTLVHIDMIPRACLGGPCAGCVLLLQIAARRCHARAPRPSCSWIPGPLSRQSVCDRAEPVASCCRHGCVTHPRVGTYKVFKCIPWYSGFEGQGLDASRQRIDLAVLRALLVQAQHGMTKATGTSAVTGVLEFFGPSQPMDHGSPCKRTTMRAAKLVKCGLADA
ncbi:hypothetical protein OH76DRAFT_22256 [Lentinus brumalis]|uniref:Uncharacterized protein n=1 Tax=Lentinus brumalis TaxID=2498619 RepID=A0A371DXC3_9APHY|nr:hypothetical protein OH76DRAFT_22256 [Polyporus brumalis]